MPIHQTRRVQIAGIHPQPYGEWMAQMARNLTDPFDGFLRNHQGLDNRLVERAPAPVTPGADIRRRQRVWAGC